MSQSWQSSREKSLCRCRNSHHHHWSPPGGKYLVIVFTFLIGIAFLFIVFLFHVQLFVLVYFFDSIFPPTTPNTKTTAVEYWKIPTPSIPFLKNEGRISPSCIIRNPLHLLRGNNLLPCELITTSIPAYPVWQHQLRLQLWWVSSYFPEIVLSQSCIAYPHQAQVFVKIHKKVEGEFPLTTSLY